MTTILHMSDMHFGTEDDQVITALLTLAAEQAPDLCLLSGDVTQRARRQQFTAAAQFVRLLQRPVLTIPGNHDLPLFNLLARLFNPYGNYHREFGPELEPLHESEELLVIGVNTTRAARHKNGEVSAAQIERVALLLEQAQPQQLRIVMQHHPVRAVEGSDISNLLIGREQAVPAWTEAGLDILLAGHIHLPYILPLQARPDSRRAWTVQAGTGVSRRVRGNIPNSVNLIRHCGAGTEHQCVVERWDFSQEHSRFQLQGATPLILSRNG